MLKYMFPPELRYTYMSDMSCITLGWNICFSCYADISYFSCITLLLDVWFLMCYVLLKYLVSHVIRYAEIYVSMYYVMLKYMFPPELRFT